MINTNHTFTFFICLFFATSCLKDKTPSQPHIIHLEWNKSFSEDNLEQALIGLAWTYSQIGAMNANAILEMPVQKNEVRVNIRQLGLNTQAVSSLEKLHHKMIDSEEYKRNATIDMGRYVALLIGASEHYYAFTGMPSKLTDLLSEYTLQDEKGHINNSSLTSKNRILSFSDQTGLHQIFITQETDPETAETVEYETIDIMPNGQLRYGIYDAEGNLENNANILNSNAGKPGKCMWCHESSIQPLLGEQADIDGYLEYLVLRDTLLHYRAALQNNQAELTSGVDFTKFQDHAQMELLYTSFMEPSAQRLSQEWKLSIEKVNKILTGIPTHINEEHPYLGNLYDRTQVQEFAPYRSLQPSSNVREDSDIEVNYLD